MSPFHVEGFFQDFVSRPGRRTGGKRGREAKLVDDLETGRTGDVQCRVEHTEIARDVRIVVELDDSNRLPGTVEARADPVSLSDLRAP